MVSNKRRLKLPTKLKKLRSKLPPPSVRRRKPRRKAVS
ncbi:hypothetical protein AWRI1631_150490 [Saccharomyces cerevisiae AWRI1631]|uniref:Uncharacterized protein n=1 Tax=Saccharomyces cerevisiae (strain AWRI1631) TaxID=545124 RepID=B5VRE7_YEAS6|nr:hypothetical protein AWRI1631_150490 [Saccharomyces cerevisiae AWRI1631]